MTYDFATYSKTYRTNHPGRGAANSKAYRQRHPRRSREIHLRRKFGITVEQWDFMFEQQGTVCACCGTVNPGSKSGWSTDHNPHRKKGDPKFIRGIVCHPCNRAMHKNATPEWLRQIADFMEKHK